MTKSYYEKLLRANIRFFCEWGKRVSLKIAIDFGRFVFFRKELTFLHIHYVNKPTE